MALMLLLATVIHLSFLGKKEMCVRVINYKKYAGVLILEDFTGEENDYCF